MKLSKMTGFTIIETMLFLAVSGFLFVAILAGTGNSINVQRYHDGVYSLQSFLQNQYSEIVNVSNDSTQNQCGTTGNIPRGQSDCVILGRYITTSDNGQSLNVYRVIGSDEAVTVGDADDINVFKQYNIQLLKDSSGSFSVDNYSFEWGVILKNIAASGGGVSHFSVLILRSPNSGIVRTFADPSDESVSNDKIQQLLSDSYSKNEIKTCVDSNGLTSTPKSAVLIHADAAVQSDIEVLGEKDSGC